MERKGLIIECPQKLSAAIERVYSTPGNNGPESLLHCLNSILRFTGEGKRVIVWDDGSEASFYWESQTYDAIEEEWKAGILGGINWSEVTETYTVNT